MKGMNKVLFYQPCGPSDLGKHLLGDFEHELVTTPPACMNAIAKDDYKVIVLDLMAQNHIDLAICHEVAQYERRSEVPIIVLIPSNDLRYKLQAFEYGCDDVIGSGCDIEEVSARINKSIFNVIANEQLKSRLHMANETAYTAMSDNSDLGNNLHFLVEENRCNNLDELGQLLFMTLERYDISCSLQMRSVYGTKNMEANGMAKDLESQLLEQLQSAGRYVDFGRRTIMNYGQVSLLVRNMPLDNPKRYGSLKDNLFTLLKGLDARVKALDARNKLMDEKKALHKLSSDVRDVMAEIDRSYQQVMRDIANAVEDMAESVQAHIPSLALSEEQERFFEDTIVNCVVNTNRIFNEGLKVDEVFQNLSDGMDKALLDVAFIDEEVDPQIEQDANTEIKTPQNRGLELF